MMGHFVRVQNNNGRLVMVLRPRPKDFCTHVIEPPFTGLMGERKHAQLPEDVAVTEASVPVVRIASEVGKGTTVTLYLPTIAVDVKPRSGSS